MISTMAPLYKRPLDLFIVFVFVQFLFIAITIDFVQSVYGSFLATKEIEYGYWPPAAIVDAYAWWCKNVDVLLAHNPIWLETMAWLSPFVYSPFYCFAIYAFLYEKEWIRVPALMWSWGLLICMAVVTREELYGLHPTKNVQVFIAAYGAYALMPIVVMLRVANAPLFGKTKQN